MQSDPRSRVDSVYLSYLPEEEAARQQQMQQMQMHQRNAQPPSVTVTSSSPVEEPALRRPLHLGIATAAANNAARAAAAAAQRPPIQQQQPQQSRVQQKLQRNNGTSPPRNGPASPVPMPNGPGRNNAMPLQQQQEHVHSQQQQQRGQPILRQAGPNGMRPFELRTDVSQPHYPQQHQGQQPQGRRPALPVLHVTVPQQTHQAAPRQHMPPQQNAQRQGGGPPSPFSSSTDTLVGTPYDKKNIQYANNKGWSPSSSASSSSHTHTQHQPPSPAFAAGQQYPNSPYGHPPPSPSIKNLQLQIPSKDRLADPENDRLSPAMPGKGSNQKDFWKRFSHVVRENEVREQLAEKSGSKGPKVQSEWLDAQAHKQRNYRIWVGVVAFVILAAIGGGVAYHYVTKDKDSKNAVTQPTTHGLEPDSDSSSSQFISPTQASGTRAQASPSAVPAGNIIGTRDHLGKRAAEALTEPIRPAALLAARSFHGAAAHARRHKNLNHLD